MSAAEQLEDPPGKRAAAARRAARGRGLHRSPTDAVAGQAGAKLRPLLALAPYVARYRGRAMLAFISLTVAAVTTLVVPIAVRRMIDFGFSPEGIAMINSYFSVMIAVVAVLACASASRFYLVMTIGDHRCRSAARVFAHLISLSPAFFDSARSGELVSRLTADTTQIKSAVGASVSIALRNLMLFLGATVMMVITSPKLSGFVLLAIPVIVIPLVAFGRWVRRLSRNAQDRWRAAAYASELVGAVRTVQAYTSERMADTLSAAKSNRPMRRRGVRTRRAGFSPRIIIFIIFSSVVTILWVGCATCWMGSISPGRLGQLVLYAVFAAAGLGQLSEVWGDLSAASGAAERLFELLRVNPEIAAPASPRALPQPARGDVGFDNVSFAYPTRPNVLAVDGVSLAVATGEKIAVSGRCSAKTPTFREGQREAIEAVIDDGSRALVVQRTGWGKSLVYWIATRVRRDQGHGPALIVSPLLALMRNQIAMAARLGLEAVTINSGNVGEWEEIEERLGPRRDRRPPDLAGAARERGLHDPRPAVDRAHDRPARHRRGPLHLRLGPRLPARLPAHLRVSCRCSGRPCRCSRRRRPRTTGSSRTSPPSSASTSRSSAGPLARDTLRLDAIRLDDQAERLAWLAENLPRLPGSGIVYCLTVADTERVAALPPAAGDRRPRLQRPDERRRTGRRSRTP